MLREALLVGEHLLTVREVAELLKVSRRTVWRWVALGRMPGPVRYSRTCVRWKASVLQAYLEALPAGGPA
jgi:excisionase family DNA binding protein